MSLNFAPFFVLFIFSQFTTSFAARLGSRRSCAQGYTPCSPPGATKSLMPPVGEELSGLYFDLVSSVNPQPIVRDITAHQIADQNQLTAGTVCCAQGADCRVLQTYNLAFCWDRFTTDFYLADGSYGNISTGVYHSSTGTTVNLVSGDVALPYGQTENIYSRIPQAKPVTSLLLAPTVGAGTRVGTTIRNSKLGTEPTHPTSAYAPTTLPPITLSFPDLTSANASVTQARSTGNFTGFPAYLTGTIQTCGCGPPPAPTTSQIVPFRGGSVAIHLPNDYAWLSAILLICLVHFSIWA